MRKTETLGLPIYDTPETDLFRFQDWNEGNQNIENKVKELKETIASKTVINSSLTIDKIQELINNDTSGIIEFSSASYHLTKKIVLNGNKTYIGNDSKIYCYDNCFELKENEENIKIKDFNFIGNLKFTNVTSVSSDRLQATVQEAVFDIGDVVGCSNYGVVDDGYLTITNKSGNTYTFNRTVNDNGRILEDKYGQYLGTFRWSSLIKGSHRNHGFRLENCTFDKSNGYAFTIPNSNDVEIKNCHIKNNGLDCCLFSAEDGVTKHLVIDNVVFEQQKDMGKQGIVIMGDKGQIYEDITIKNCTFNDTTESGISLGYARGLINGLKILNNVFNNNNLFSMHVGGKNILIDGNIVKGSISAIRYNDVDGEKYIPATKSLMKNITITNNFIESANGITITKIKDTSDVYMYPSDINIKNNNIFATYNTCEVCGRNINIQNNNFTSESEQSADRGAISNIYIGGTENRNINIKNNSFSGYAYLRWEDVFNLTVEENVFNATPHPKGRFLVKSTNEPSYDRLIRIINNIFYNGDNSSMLTTNNGLGGEEYKNNKWVSTDNKVYNIPYVKGVPARWQPTQIRSEKLYWKNNSNESEFDSREEFLNNGSYYAYIDSNGVLKTTNNISNTPNQ